MKPYMSDQVVGRKPRSGARHARLPHRGGKYQVTGLLIANRPLHRGKVRAEAVVRPQVEADLPDCRSLAEQHVEVGRTRIMPGRSSEPDVRRIVDVVKRCRARQDTAVHAVVPEVRDGGPVAAVIVMRGEPLIGEQRAVRHDVNRARPILATVAASIGRVLSQPGNTWLDDRLAQRVGERGIEEQRLPGDWLDCCNANCERTGKSGDCHYRILPVLRYSGLSHMRIVLAAIVLVAAASTAAAQSRGGLTEDMPTPSIGLPLPHIGLPLPPMGLPLPPMGLPPERSRSLDRTSILERSGRSERPERSERLERIHRPASIIFFGWPYLPTGEFPASPLPSPPTPPTQAVGRLLLSLHS